MFARVTLAAAVLLTAVGAVTQSPPPVPLAAVAPVADAGALKLATERVIVFKDGYGLFAKTASGVADAEGRVHTYQVPNAAVLGTFWAVPEGRELRATIAEWYETVRPKMDEGSCLSTADLLRANEGKQVTFGLGDKELSGKVIDLLEAPALRPKPQANAEGSTETELAARGGDLVAIEVADKSRLIIPVSSVKTLAGKDLSLHCLRPGEIASRSKRLTFDFGPQAAGKAVSLRIFYFTSGVRWIPTYRVNTGSSNKAELELQAEILNEQEDFEKAAVDLVVGAPSFKFKDTLSPMSLEQTLRSAITRAMPALLNSNLMISNASFSSRAGERSNEDEGTSAPPRVTSIAAELGAEGHQDMFVYPVKTLGLKKGSRALVPLWHSRVPQRHLYTAHFGTYSAYAASASARSLTTNQVRHELELTDDTDVPFTTGAAMVMEGGLPLGQDVLGYTSPGGKTMLPVTTALNLRATQKEREVSRTTETFEFDGRRYVAIKNKGTITLVNHQKEKATMRITLGLAGKVDRVSHGGVVVLNSEERVNQQSSVTWEVTVRAGETVDLTYDYGVYR